jgi:hypothetical protein
VRYVEVRDEYPPLLTGGGYKTLQITTAETRSNGHAEHIPLSISTILVTVWTPIRRRLPNLTLPKRPIWKFRRIRKT